MRDVFQAKLGGKWIFFSIVFEAKNVFLSFFKISFCHKSK